VRLVGGWGPYEGRVEVFYNNEWRTVCDDSFDQKEARVICNQLGYYGNATAKSDAFFGEGAGKILLDDLQCTGSERKLIECGHNGRRKHNCGHSEDASVICTGRLSIKLTGLHF
ncbi:hypothetical protein FSP39_013751, partial [Pinctada imbricata]